MRCEKTVAANLAVSVFFLRGFVECRLILLQSVIIVCYNFNNVKIVE